MNEINKVGVISIIIEDPEAVDLVNSLLHKQSEYIIGRLGIPYREKNISIISVAVDAPQNVISALSGELGNISGVSSKAVITKV